MITFNCPNCTRKCNAAGEHAGKRAKCGKCHQPLTIPIGNSLPKCTRCAKDLVIFAGSRSVCPGCKAVHNRQSYPKQIISINQQNNQTEYFVFVDYNYDIQRKNKIAEKNKKFKQKYISTLFILFIIIIIFIIFISVIAYFTDDATAPKPAKPAKPGYQPLYPEYHNLPGLAPIDRVQEWSPEQKSMARDAVIGSEISKGRLR